MLTECLEILEAMFKEPVKTGDGYLCLLLKPVKLNLETISLAHFLRSVLETGRKGEQGATIPRKVT
jgi:hypothetical protein